MDKGVSATVVSARKNRGFHLERVDWWTLAPTLDIGVIVFKPQQKPLGEVKAPISSLSSILSMQLVSWQKGTFQATIQVGGVSQIIAVVWASPGRHSYLDF